MKIKLNLKFARKIFFKVKKYLKLIFEKRHSDERIEEIKQKHLELQLKSGFGR